MPPATDAQDRLRSACEELTREPAGDGLAWESSEIVIAGPGPREYCHVVARFSDSRLRFQLWMPTRGWNQRMAFIGGGGFDGVLMDDKFEFILSPSVLEDGYAMVSTNGGYDKPDSINPLTYFEAEFTSDPTALADFMYLSEHRTLPFADRILEDFYGQAPQFRYFEGCSMGGHDAMLLSQRYPEDFDGIVARAPAGNIMGLLLQFNRVGSHLQNHASELNEEQRALLAEAVLARCDSLDGIEDGIIARLEDCTPDVDELLCSVNERSGCLGPEHAELIYTATSPLNVADHEFTHPGYPLDGVNLEAGWGAYIWPKMLGYSVQMLFAQGFVRAFVTADPEYDPWQWDPEEWLPELRAIDEVYNADSPDLSGFRQAGGKLILWNGMLDASVSSRETGNYYDAIVDTIGQAAAEQTVELFLSPGVGHCKDGPGPDQVDLMAALSAWVENGVPPSQQALVAHGVNDEGAVDREMPLCKYPAFPRYVSGDSSKAGSYVCSID